MKYKSRLQGWKRRTLSWGDRATLINSVLQTILVYTMSILKVPKQVCHQLDQLSCKFWQNVSDTQSCYYTPLSQDNLCYPKKLGRLGFKKFESINMALLTKLAWQIQTEPNRLWVHIFRSKYLQGVDLLTATSYKSGSWAWKGQWRPLLY